MTQLKVRGNHISNHDSKGEAGKLNKVTYVTENNKLKVQKIETNKQNQLSLQNLWLYH